MCLADVVARTAFLPLDIPAGSLPQELALLFLFTCCTKTGTNEDRSGLHRREAGRGTRMEKNNENDAFIPRVGLNGG